MRNIKDFQARYDRWKNGERYWDIRGIDLPRYDTGDKNTVVTDDGSVFNVDPSAIGARNLEVTTPEVQVIAQKPLYLKKRDQLLGDIIYNPGEIRQGKKPSVLDNVRTFLSNYRNNPIARNVEQSIEDWQHRKTPMQAAFNNFAYINPYTATLAAVNNLSSDHGIRRTVNLAKNGQYGNAVLSGLGDLLDASMLTYGGRYIKNNGAFDAVKLFENTKFGNYLQNKIIPRSLTDNFTLNYNGYNGVKLIPLKNSSFDNYANSIYTRLNMPLEYPEIRLTNPSEFKTNVIGTYTPLTRIARISPKSNDPLSTAIHEAVSHHTDRYVENMPINRFIPDINVNLTVADVYRFLSQYGDRFHKIPESSNWNEMRATLNELRGNSYLSKENIDDISDGEILYNLRNTNGYGNDYYNSIIKSDAAENAEWFNIFRTAWKYLPVITPPLIQSGINYEKEK